MGRGSPALFHLLWGAWYKITSKADNEGVSPGRSTCPSTGSGVDMDLTSICASVFRLACRMECCHFALCPFAQRLERLNLEQLPNFYIYASTRAFNIQRRFPFLPEACWLFPAILLADMSATFQQFKPDFLCDLIQLKSTSSSGPVLTASQKRFSTCRW